MKFTLQDNSHNYLDDILTFQAYLYKGTDKIAEVYDTGNGEGIKIGALYDPESFKKIQSPIHLIENILKDCMEGINQIEELKKKFRHYPLPP